jgi:hypothetical protein
MNELKINKNNFHKYTFCIFKQVDLSEIENLKMNFKSKSGSSYYFTETGVYRLSNHWSRVANCRWRLLPNPNTVTLSAVEVPNSHRVKLGFALWTNFYPDNDFEKLYFIEVDFELKEVNYFHKNGTNYNQDKVLRTATETTKTIKQVRTLFEEIAWSKYLNEENIDVLRKEIIQKLISTNLTFQEIRKSYL